mmetsp:Transcript_35626/g.63365  ORF Transcript_35626/g.63365 Transcript_35626/m.63365 type:complete len:378 (-) Transcript_35626:7-1140(-)
MAHLYVLIMLASFSSVSSLIQQSGDLLRHLVIDMQGASHEGIDSQDLPRARCKGAEAIVDGVHTIEFDGLLRRYDILKPVDYVSGETRDVLLLFHAFGGSPSSILSPFSTLADLPDGPILVAPEGFSVQIAGQTVLPAGFNGAGSSMGIGPEGETCHPTAIPYPCHSESCGQSCHRCAWTSCADDVGFVLAVLDVVESSLCAQHHRVFATGFSGGGQFIFELATDPRSSARLTAVAPLHGLPHRGFLRHAPSGDQPRFIGIWGGINSTFQDRAYPPLSTPGQDPDTSLDSLFSFMPRGNGWYFSTARNTTAFWGQHVDCAAASSKQNDSAEESVQTFSESLSCTSFCGGRVVECLRSTNEHSLAAFYPSTVWDFFVN